MQVTSSVIIVNDLGRSVDFYSTMFGCKTSLREDNAALLLAPDGFQLYLLAKGDEAPHPTGGIGTHHLMWATDDPDSLTDIAEKLKSLGNYTDTHTSGGVTFVEGRDPDGIRIVVAHPSPEQRPRSVLDWRLYN